MSVESTAPATPGALRDRFGSVYQPAIGPRLKPLLALLFVGFAFLAATGAYLTTLRVIGLVKTIDLTNVMTLWVFLAHLVGGVIIIVPFLFFGIIHWRSARTRRNRRAIRLGKLLFYTGVLVCLSGLALAQVHDRIQLPTGTLARWIVYGLHVALPLVAVFVYVLHRRASTDIQWRWGVGWGISAVGFIGAMVYLHSQDPRLWNPITPKEGVAYFHPSAARTGSGNFIPADTLMMDTYCMKCHEDIYKDHLHSAHKFSSFNNPAYLFSVRETRKVSMDHDGNTKRSRWCAGCHDPVPFFSGQFDDPKFDDVNNPTAHAGITCTACHSVTHVNSARGNADYVIEEPLHYPFAKSDSGLLQYLNNQLVKAKPDFHKKTFLKPFHKTAEFCSTCHKVSLPVELNQYKEFLRGQNHYDPFLLSGAKSGTRSFYYPPKAKDNCSDCHMPLAPSEDFASKDFDGTGVRKRHNHLFPGANTGLPWMLSLRPDQVKGAATPEGLRKAALAHADFLRGTDPDRKDQKLRIDLFGLKTGGGIGGGLTVLRPDLPALTPGSKYLVEVVIRTVNIGHPFTQGTVDSNEVWVHFQARQKDKILAENGGMVETKGAKGEQKLPERDYVTLDDRAVDKHSHFVNVLMLDRDGNRINRRNPQDIFTPLYNHQIPPGAGQVVHYELEVPRASELAKDEKGRPTPVTLKVRLRYRKFDREYMSLVFGKDPVPQLPVVDMCEDEVILPVEGGAAVAKQSSPIKPAWQRWNDYGIGCYLEGGADEHGGLSSKKGNLSQAMQAFQQLTKSQDGAAHAHGYLNMARVAFDLGQLDQAREYLAQAGKAEPPAKWWTVAWLTARINVENGRLEEAANTLEKALAGKAQPLQDNFDFRRDYVVVALLADTYFRMAQRHPDNPEKRDPLLRKAIATFEKVLAEDPENLDAHFGLFQSYQQLGAGVSNTVRPNQEDEGKEIAALAEILLDAKRPAERRAQASLALAKALERMGQEKYRVATKTPTCNALDASIGKLFRETNEPLVRQAAAFALASVHRELNNVFKPDDLAESKAREKHRKNHPDADRASQAIVIYPTDRK